MYLLQNIHCHKNSLEMNKFKPFNLFFLKFYEFDNNTM